MNFGLMIFIIWIYILFQQIALIKSWDLAIFLTPQINIGDNFQIKCLVTGDTQYSPMFLYCPVNNRNTEYLCFEDCKKLNDNTNNMLSSLNCQYNMNSKAKSLIYFSNFDESWLTYNNSYFKCKFMDKVASVQLIIQNKTGNQVFSIY